MTCDTWHVTQDTWHMTPTQPPPHKFGGMWRRPLQKKLHPMAQTYWRTWRLYDWIGPVGRFSENPFELIYAMVKFFSFWFDTALQCTCLEESCECVFCQDHDSGQSVSLLVLSALFIGELQQRHWLDVAGRQEELKRKSPHTHIWSHQILIFLVDKLTKHLKF